MGLLDDAIREHLELKRLRGADPGAVAREEHDALGPVLSDPAEEQGDRQTPVSSGESLTSSAEPTSAPSSDAGQETIEINMEAELGGDTAGASPMEHTKRITSATHPAQAQSIVEESLEWEVPTDRREESERAEESGGSFDSSDDPQEAEHVDDVLEETPDFLRGTPEQERLWFEQRPPRDFDFNE